MREVSGLFQRPLIFRGALLRVHELSANMFFSSYCFGTLTPGGADVCQLYAVPAASVPAPASGQSLQVYDVGCSV